MLSDFLIFSVDLSAEGPSLNNLNPLHFFMIMNRMNTKVAVGESQFAEMTNNKEYIEN